VKADKKQTDLFRHLVVMADTFAACIETGVMPAHGSPCHRWARRLVDASGMRPQRKRRRLPTVNKQPKGAPRD
jgi:hypothetical protein